ncbi:LysM domain-containing protein [Apiospora kogelbergensis]|uniref:LysM domain-containing protein n=1 Tax=Apiospora kogelbergensis TaxID=1337665 RepID=UPI00312DE7D6
MVAIGRKYQESCTASPSFYPRSRKDPFKSTCVHLANQGIGIETPLPTQPELVKDCGKFHLVESGESCSAIASANGITLTQFLGWNAAAGRGCSGLWADAYACVHVVGYHKPTPAQQPRNGVATPAPIQKGQTCAVIASQYHVSVGNLVSWNTAVGPGCTGMWAETYLCVGVL